MNQKIFWLCKWKAEGKENNKTINNLERKTNFSKQNNLSVVPGGENANYKK
jgi:hypothetical protein